MKAVVAAFNQEKAKVRALVGAFSVIVKTDGSFCSTTQQLLDYTMRPTLGHRHR